MNALDISGYIFPLATAGTVAVATCVGNVLSEIGVFYLT
jgi:hypothetical protein